MRKFRYITQFYLQINRVISEVTIWIDTGDNSWSAIYYPDNEKSAYKNVYAGFHVERLNTARGHSGNLSPPHS